MTSEQITNEQINIRIDNMLAWANGVNTKLTQIAQRLEPDVAQAGAIVESMMELDALQVSRAGDMGMLQDELANQRADIADQKKSIAEKETEAMMFAEGGNADKRKAATAAALKSNEEYQELKKALAINERGKLVKQAHFDTAEREYKRLGEQLRNLRARLEHWTARAKMSIGE